MLFSLFLLFTSKDFFVAASNFCFSSAMKALNLRGCKSGLKWTVAGMGRLDSLVNGLLRDFHIVQVAPLLRLLAAPLHVLECGGVLGRGRLVQSELALKMSEENSWTTELIEGLTYLP
jgi:hypothetical protein